MSCTRVTPAVIAVLVVAFVISACGDDAPAGSEVQESTSTRESAPTPGDTSTQGDTTAQTFPDVLGATAELGDDGTWRFDVTVSSPYDTPERYADAWRVVGPDTTVYGVRELAHDHAGEQPFTRSLGGVEIPDDVDRVVVEARDLANGWGGGTFDVVLSRG